MFSKKKMNTSIDNYSQIKNWIHEADAIVIGAGAGLSTAAGFTYSGERFDQYFHDFQEKYGITDMYSGGFYPFQTLEEYWAWWSRHIYYNRYVDIPNDTYTQLLKLVRNKDYFVITTNVDHCFIKAGFDKERLFYTQGDYGLFQCSTPCHQQTYDNQEQIQKMVTYQKHMKIPTSFIPYCPHCGKPMTVNLRCDNTFVEDAGWEKACQRYQTFLQTHKEKKVLFLEIGVGQNTPSIIKYPFWNMTHQYRHAHYVCINLDDVRIPREIDKKSICIQENINEALKNILD